MSVICCMLNSLAGEESRLELDNPVDPLFKALVILIAPPRSREIGSGNRYRGGYHGPQVDRGV